MPLKAFHAPVSPETFVSSVKESLAGRPLGDLVSLSLEGQNLLVHFSKLGKSELRFGMTVTEGGFQAKLEKESIALAHRAFRAEIERKLVKVLERCGATASL